MLRARMGFVHFTVAVLSFLSVGQSAPVTSCDSLIQQVEIRGRDQLLGKWMYIAESTNMAGFKLLVKMFVESNWGNVTAANESDAINVFHAQKMFGRCYTLTTKMTLVNNTLSMVQPFSVSEVLLNSGCLDCLVLQSNYIIGGSVYRGLQFLSRREKVTAAEMEEFMKQVECLNLPPPTIMDPEKGFCTDESTFQETETTDLTNTFIDMNSEYFNLFEKIMTSDGEIMKLLKMISSGIAGVKQNKH